MNLAEALAGHVGVDLRRANPGVPQQFLDDPEVRAVFEQMGGKAVTEHMRRHVSGDAGQPDAMLDPLPERATAEGTAALGQENVGGALSGYQPGAADLDVTLEGLDGLVTRIPIGAADL